MKNFSCSTSHLLSAFLGIQLDEEEAGVQILFVTILERLEKSDGPTLAQAAEET